MNEGQAILGRLDAVTATTGAPIGIVTADAGYAYAYAKVFAGPEAREITGVIPTKAEPIRSKVPLRRFRYDARHDIVRCPKGKISKPNKAKIAHGRFFASKARDCKGCDLAALLPVAIARDQGRRHRSRLPGPAAGPSPTAAVGGGGQPPLTCAIAGGPRASTARPRPGPRARPRRASRPRQHAHPGLPHRRRDQPQAARRSPPRPDLRPPRAPERARPRLSGRPGAIRCMAKPRSP